MADDDGGVSSELERESDLDAATMIGGVDSNADENSPDKLRNKLIVLTSEVAERRRLGACYLIARIVGQINQLVRHAIKTSHERVHVRCPADPTPAGTVYSTGTGDELNAERWPGINMHDPITGENRTGWSGCAIVASSSTNNNRLVLINTNAASERASTDRLRQAMR